MFCYSFWPTHDASLPGHPARPAGNGDQYRIEVEGPGVTPTWNPNDPATVTFEQMQALQLNLSRSDKFCPTQI